MPFHGETQAARGGEIERARIARDLADHESQFAAAQAFFQGEQCILRTLRGDMDQTMAQVLRQAGTIRPPGQPERRRILHP